MLLTIRLMLLFFLIAILLQDFWFRAVHWIFFPLLTIGLFSLQLAETHDYHIALQQSIINLAFLLLIFALLTLYLSVRKKKLINISKGMLGWADILFLVAIAFYLSVINFLFFYIASILSTLLLWLLYKGITGNKSRQIPLAGFQSLLFIVFLAGDWWCFHIHITDDYWLLRNLMPWIQH
ncbi:hypothetical protein [Mucilaginibacter flavus]|uniref:hypothetical protein n=1 Tax=Mucilaginibacter flavus TaxID=931504 RepID=UPI0025B378C7|nr:hypothetical protein [Mucilaginibacter flavus]MDN3580768.1 hypothetical protein [Mucilaginibacter flavus]